MSVSRTSSAERECRSAIVCGLKTHRARWTELGGVATARGVPPARHICGV